MIRTTVSVFAEDRLFADALIALLRTEPSLVVCRSDLSEPRGSGVIVVVDVRSGDATADGWPRLAGQGALVILVSAPEDDEWAVEALGKGARGILTRSASPEDLLKAIAIVRSGSIWARRRWLNACVQKGAARYLEHSVVRHVPPGTRLSPREEQVFRHAASGAANKELAQQLAISEATVKVHLTHIFQKLGVNGRAELAAVYHGLRAVPRASTTDVETPHKVAS